MKIAEIIKLDHELRKIGISGVYGPWDDEYSFFSIGEGKDSKNAYPGNTPETIRNAKPVFIDIDKFSKNKYEILFIKNDELNNKINYIEFGSLKEYF